MKPIRIYAGDTYSSMQSNYYIWEQDGNCIGGDGCSGCLFNPSKIFCTIYELIPQIHNSYKPSRGYIELTLDSHPEVFL